MNKEKRDLLVANSLVAITIAILLGLGALLSSGCHEMDDDIFEVDAEDDGHVDPLDLLPHYWIILEGAKINSFRVDTDDYLPDPFAILHRGGDIMGKTASCDMETYEPRWEDHVHATTTVQFMSDSWTVHLYDYELEPSGNNWLGSCRVNITPVQIEHELVVLLEDCEGAVESIAVRFERFSDDIDIDTDLERNPNC